MLWGPHPCWSLDFDGVITPPSRVFASDNWDYNFFRLVCATLYSLSLSLLDDMSMDMMPLLDTV